MRKVHAWFASATVACAAQFCAASEAVAHWTMDHASGTVVADASGNALNGTLVAGGWTAGRIGNAVALPPSGGGIVVGDAPALRVTGSLTISAWVRVRVPSPAAPAVMRIVSKKASWDAAAGYDLEYDAFNNRLTLLAGGSDFARALNVDLDDGWHHVVATVAGTAAKLYVDGVDVTSDGSVGALAAGTAPLAIGRHSGGGWNTFDGALDDLRIYPRALAPAEITALSQATVPAGLVGRWMLDEGGGTLAADSSGRGNHGTLTTTTHPPSGPRPGPTWTTGVGGGAVAFSGAVTQGIRVGDQPSLNIRDRLALSAWVRVADPGLDADMRVVSKKYNWDDQHGFSLEYNPAKNQITLLGGGRDYLRATGIDLDTGWHHLAAMADGTAGRIWVDGVEVTTDGTIGAIAPSSQPFWIGLNSSGFAPWQGGVDEVTVWADPIAAADVVLLASRWPNQGVAGPFQWVRKLRAPAAARPATIARDGTVESLVASTGDAGQGTLTLEAWSGDNQAGGRSWAANNLVGEPGRNYFIGLHGFSLREGVDTTGSWVYTQKRTQDAQLRFGFAAADRATMPLGHGLGTSIGSALPYDAVVVCLPFRHDATGRPAWQVAYHAGNPLQAGIWQIPSGQSLVQAQADVKNRLSNLGKLVKKTVPGDPALSFKLEIANGVWRLDADVDGDGVADQSETSADGGNRASTLTAVSSGSGLMLNCEAAGGSGPGRVGRTTAVIGWRESSGAPAGVAAR